VTPFARSADGVPIAYESHGARTPAIVLVHGWCCNRTYWDAQLTALSGRWRIVAVDLAGHGDSGNARADWTMGAFGADVVAVVEALALQSVVLVGHSMGADVVLEAAGTLGGRVVGVVCVDQYAQLARLPSDAEVRARVAAFRAGFPTTVEAFVRTLFSPSASAALVDRVSTDMTNAPRESALACLEATWNHGRSVPAMLSRLEPRVLAINSSGSAADIESMRRHGVEVVLMQGAGHFPMLERPEEFNGCLVRAIESFGSRPRKQP
jgi:pimeloyl-ACP methyl ester carboxylesterase